jgi:hypothetical protein
MNEDRQRLTTSPVFSSLVAFVSGRNVALETYRSLYNERHTKRRFIASCLRGKIRFRQNQNSDEYQDYRPGH